MVQPGVIWRDTSVEHVARDSFGVEHPKYIDCGGIYERWIDGKGVGGTPPLKNASRRPGEWQEFHIWFQGPRFDASGKKVSNAKFVRVLHNGTLIHKNVEAEGPTRSGLQIPEASENPLMLQGDHGPVAYVTSTFALSAIFTKQLLKSEHL